MLTVLATIGLVVFTCTLVASSIVLPQFVQLAPEDESAIDGSVIILALGIVGVLGVSYLFNIIVICMFMYRANANVRALGAQGVENTPGWCGGYWFIPIVNFVMPYRCMSEIHRASQNPMGRDWKSNAPHSLMGVWWGFWVLGLILDRFTRRSEAFNLEQYDVIFQWIGTALFVGAAISLIVILRSITSLQNDHAEKMLKN